MSLEPLFNKGLVVLNKENSIGNTEKTVIVLGSARGGTTMVASVLDALGVFMGENLGPVYEDVVLSDVVERGDTEYLSKLIDARNRQYEIWGWKRPAALQYLNFWEGRFRNPHYIVVFRDPLAIANRNRISMLSDVLQNMRDTVAFYDRLIAHLIEVNHPLLLCSYEKVLAFPREFVVAVCDFLGLDTQDRVEPALQRIKPGDRTYLENSRITQSIGNLDVANRNFCSGWAFFRHNPTLPVQVEIRLGNELIATVPANRKRPDLKDRGLHPTGQCGFLYNWPDHVKPQVGDEVAVKAKGDIRPLRGSPKRITE